MKPFHAFWSLHPCLAYGSAMTIALLTLLYSPYFLILAFLYYISCPRHLLWISAVLFFFASAHSLPHQLITANISLHSVTKQHELFHYKGVAQGVLHPLQQRMLVHIFTTQAYDLNTIYTCYGKLNPDFTFTIDHVISSKAQSKYHRTITWIKQKITAYIHKRYLPQQAFCLQALILGDISSASLYQEFKALGLAPLIAISGLHFSCLTALLQLLFKPLSYRVKTVVILILLSAYACILLPSPAVERAWICAIVFYFSWWLKRMLSNINILGCALMISLCIHPYYIRHIGFQLSYVGTLSIILFYPYIKELLQHLFLMPYFRKVQLLWINSLALFISVHILLFPILSAYFSKIALHGWWHQLVYSMFFMLTIVLFVIATIVEVLHLPLHSYNAHLLSWIMDSLHHRFMPLHHLYVPSLSIVTSTCYIVSVCMIAMIYRPYDRLKTRQFSF